MLGRGFGRIDPERFDRVNRVQNFLDLRPARDPQENVCAWLHVWRHGVRLARRDCTKDVDLRQDRAVIVGRPVHDGEDAVGRVAHDPAAIIDDLLLRDMTETDPGLDALLDPQEFDMSQSADGQFFRVRARHGSHRQRHQERR